MTQHENLCFVDVPDGATDFDMPEQDFGQALQYKANGRWNSEMLPHEHNWRFIDLHSQMTEEKAREVVNNLFERSYRNYELPEDHPGWGGPYVYDTALESYHSLCRHLGLKGEQAVLKKL